MLNIITKESEPNTEDVFTVLQPRASYAAGANPVSTLCKNFVSYIDRLQRSQNDEKFISGL